MLVNADFFDGRPHWKKVVALDEWLGSGWNQALRFFEIIDFDEILQLVSSRIHLGHHGLVTSAVNWSG